MKNSAIIFAALSISLIACNSSQPAAQEAASGGGHPTRLGSADTVATAAPVCSCPPVASSAASLTTTTTTAPTTVQKTVNDQVTDAVTQTKTETSNTPKTTK